MANCAVICNQNHKTHNVSQLSLLETISICSSGRLLCHKVPLYHHQLCGNCATGRNRRPTTYHDYLA